MIAAYRPDQSVSRSAYFAGMVMGVFMVNQANGPAQAFLPEPWRTASLFVFPFGPMHLAIGYDFYVRFPSSVTTTRVWRASRTGAVHRLRRPLRVGLAPRPRADADGPGHLPGRRQPAGADYTRGPSRMLTFVFPVTGLAIIAVVTRNYRAVAAQDDRRRLRWVVWGTIVGLTPFLTVQLTRTDRRPAAGHPRWTLGDWWILANVMTALIPLSFGYAIIKHQIFDISFVIRRGLRYLLAKQALRTVIFLPVAVIAYGVVRHRDQPIGRLLLDNSAYLYFMAGAVVSLWFRTPLIAMARSKVLSRGICPRTDSGPISWRTWGNWIPQRVCQNS